MPLCLQDNALVVAFENPLNALAIEELRFLTQPKIVPAMASRTDILTRCGPILRRNHGFTLHRAAGLDHRDGTSSRGRIGLHEMLSVTAPVKHLIQARALIGDLLPAALARGMRTLKQDGAATVLQGPTDVSQVRGRMRLTARPGHRMEGA